MRVQNNDIIDYLLQSDSSKTKDKNKNKKKDGKIFVLNNEGAMLVKEVQIAYNGITLISQNTEYAPIELNAEQANNLIVIGQVVRV